jgi:hypothetical protein
MAATLAKHGTWAGYKAELQTDNVCSRCRAASRVYNSQYSKANRAKGVHYKTDQVIDHLYAPARNVTGSGGLPTRPRPAGPSASTDQRSTQHTDQATGGPDVAPDELPEMSVTDRLGRALRGAFVSQDNTYVEDQERPDYLNDIEPDPEPQSGDWSEVGEEDYVINKAGMVLIEENLGTYMSVLGITLEMIDPYCGPILAENFDNIVGRWTKVIARYPKAAKLFMSKDGGTIMTWIGALQATWPVLIAVYDHHLAKNIKTDNLGRAWRVTNTNDSPNGRVDATAPPMPGFDYRVD